MEAQQQQQPQAVEYPKCPHCGSDDVGMWAEDGESPEADFWECNDCKRGGDVQDEDVLVPDGLTPRTT